MEERAFALLLVSSLGSWRGRVGRAGTARPTHHPCSSRRSSWAARKAGLEGRAPPFQTIIRATAESGCRSWKDRGDRQGERYRFSIEPAWKQVEEKKEGTVAWLGGCGHRTHLLSARIPERSLAGCSGSQARAIRLYGWLRCVAVQCRSTVARKKTRGNPGRCSPKNSATAAHTRVTAGRDQINVTPRRRYPTERSLFYLMAHGNCGIARPLGRHPGRGATVNRLTARSGRARRYPADGGPRWTAVKMSPGW
jgi:hypothetical protein